jgi:hypothetical protein
MVAESYEAGMTEALVVRRHTCCCKLASQGALTATRAEEEVVPASAFRAQQEHCFFGGMPTVSISAVMTVKMHSNNRNLRWCSDGFEIGCDNAKKIRRSWAPGRFYLWQKWLYRKPLPVGRIARIALRLLLDFGHPTAALRLSTSKA